MAEQWITASQARALVVSTYALCARARVGMVRTRAKVFRTDDKRVEDVDVPAIFWWSDGVLEENWEIGDFATWLDRRVRMEAFGVMFAARDVLDMLPPERRGEAALRLSIAADSEWLAARDAVRFAADTAPIHDDAAPSLIVDLGRLGFATARAIEMTVVDDEGIPDASEEGFREWDVPKEFWITCEPEQNWEIGDFRGKATIGAKQRRIILNGVHFRREAIALALRTTATNAKAEPLTAESTLKNSGGRPPAAFSDDLMCAIWGRIFRGELIPKTKAAIKDAMLDWASTEGHKLGETTAKEKASKIFDACQSEGENP